MESDLAQEAIKAALSYDWEKAILVNSKILKSKRDDIDALNRIAKAYAECGDITNAKKYSEKAIKVDPANNIAIKCLEKWENFNKSKNSTANLKRISPDAFIETPKKTKIINLINLGDAPTISLLACGDSVKLAPHIHRLSVITMDGKYIGRFPDDLAAKFVKLTKLGNSYETFVKLATNKEVKIFVRAMSKSVL